MGSKNNIKEAGMTEREDSTPTLILPPQGGGDEMS